MDQPTITNLEIDEVSGNFFKDASKWARFVSWVFICSIIFTAGVIALNSSAFIDELNTVNNRRQVKMEAGLLMIFLAADMVAVLVICWFIIRAANNLKRGIDRRDQITFNEGLKALKNGFMLHGILVIVSLLVNLLTTFM